MIIVSFLQCLLYLFAIPFCIGLAFTRHFDEKYNTLGNVFSCGFLSELALFQILFLIAYKLDKKFTFLVWIGAISLIVLAIVSLIINFKTIKKIVLPKFDWGLVVFAVITVFMIVMRNFQGVNDGDDAFVLGNALTTLTNNRFYKVDYYTGFTIQSESYLRHLLASNPFFIAFISKLSFTHPAIVAHRILGSFYILLHNAIIFNIGKILFEKKETDSDKSKTEPMPGSIGMFASLVSFITIMDFHSYLTDSTFILTRTWQGKAMFCEFIIPLGIMLLLMMGESKGKKNILFIFNAIVCIAAVAMTPASIYLYTLYITVGSITVSVASFYTENSSVLSGKADDKVTMTFSPLLIFVKTLVSIVPMIGFGLLYCVYFR